MVEGTKKDWVLASMARVSCCIQESSIGAEDKGVRAMGCTE